MTISKRYSLLSSKTLMLLRIAHAPALIKPELTKTETYNDIYIYGLNLFEIRQGI